MKQKRNLVGQFTRDLPVDRIKDGLRTSILDRLRPPPVPERETDPWKRNPAKLVGR